jgi:hypothetical protein
MSHGFSSGFNNEKIEEEKELLVGNDRSFTVYLSSL